MLRVVRGADDRVWTLQADMEWRTPASEIEFEHDISSSRGSALVLAVVVVVLAVALITWTPADVVVPLWLVLMLVLLIMFFPLRWMLRRPWEISAATGDDGDGNPTEQWVGAVRGVLNVRQQVSQVARNIADKSTPGVDGPLRQVTPD
ncbi:MAG TPA: DUF983 domain-containing protein [Actinophytocola sp.]|uniref:DUF983 domain-containing protein n=1 Tax=Actinophytocola sp. TaxID=1872138 RepID=UPI002DBC4691|nr:DUF983 domain-containing protein [Actinophytocola sp.]HEU5473194.1 DUF983 domain-containing protein [Actinophytocola sp.]